MDVDGWMDGWMDGTESLARWKEAGWTLWMLPLASACVAALRA